MNRYRYERTEQRIGKMSKSKLQRIEYEMRKYLLRSHSV